MAAAGLLSLMISWWASPLYRAAAAGQLELAEHQPARPALFGATGIAPIGYAAFAFALGVTAGLLVRRTIAAMAITLAVFVAIQVLWPVFVRPHLVPPGARVRPLSAVTLNGTGDYNNGTCPAGRQHQRAATRHLDHRQHAGQRGRPADHNGPAAAASPRRTSSVPANHGVRMAVTYQPASRYWEFQWLETGIFLVLAGGLGGVCYWRIRRLA